MTSTSTTECYFLREWGCHQLGVCHAIPLEDLAYVLRLVNADHSLQRVYPDSHSKDPGCRSSVSHLETLCKGFLDVQHVHFVFEANQQVIDIQGYNNNGGPTLIDVDGVVSEGANKAQFVLEELIYACVPLTTPLFEAINSFLQLPNPQLCLFLQSLMVVSCTLFVAVSHSGMLQ